MSEQDHVRDIGSSSLTRREALGIINSAIAITVLSGGARSSAESRQASGVKVGEITDTEAIVWVRCTRNSLPNSNGVVFDHADDDKSAELEAIDPAKFKWAAPGAPGRVRVRYGVRPDLTGGSETPWVNVDEQSDFQHQFQLSGLSPNTLYFYATDTAPPSGSPVHAPVLGQFQTAPRADDAAPVTFALLNCQQFSHREKPDGFDMYPAVGLIKPQFVAFTGDNVYYDRDRPDARSIALARFHWQRMYGLPWHAELLRNVGTYWIKDDHDSYGDDCWPGKHIKRLGPFTFAEGQRVFREQVPMGPLTYRTFRWGHDLQIWFLEGRDFRSPNIDPDGPEKSILGAEQKRWLQKTLGESDATWRVLVSPTPWVGPDRGGNKADNHADPSFHHEGEEMLAWFQNKLGENFVIITGDRHWQYHSVHPKYGVHEFSIGPASDIHAQHPEKDPRYHRFFRDLGGFASVSVSRLDDRPRLAIRLHDTKGVVVHEGVFSRS